MKTINGICIVLFLATSVIITDVWARGGRGGGGARGGGGGVAASRPSPSVGRSPSVARPSTPSVARPATGGPAGGARPSTGAGVRPGTGAAGAAGAGRPSAGTRPAAGGRPSQGDVRNFLDIKPSGGVAGGVGARPGNAGAGGAAAEFLGIGGVARTPVAGALPAGGARAGAGAAVDARAGGRPDRIENRQQWQDNRIQRRDEVRNQVLDNHPRMNFWSEYPGWASLRITRPYRWATWGAITGWVGYGWSEPTSYSYGDSVYYQGDTVYQGEQPVASAEEYTQQAEAIAASAPETPPADAEWLPLGVFALTPDGQKSGPDPSLFLQLAISKEGIISGTLNNSATGQTEKIEGMADKESQRCAWTVAGKTRPVMEIGIAGLTEDSAPALVHFADGQTQQWLMVRLEEPTDQK